MGLGLGLGLGFTSASPMVSYCRQSTTSSSTTLLERIITVCAREKPTLPR